MTEPIIKLTRGVPPCESFPKEQLAEVAAEALAEYGDIILQYGPSRGFHPLRRLIADEKGCPVDHVIVGQGSLQLVDLYARMVIQPGDVVYVEEPTYDRTLVVLRRAGARVVGFPLQADGPDVDAMAARLEQGERPLFFYVIPDFQNPSGTVLSEEKRGRIAELAQRYGFWVMEDVPYRRLRYRNAQPPAFLDLAPQRTIQLSSYSKLIAPGLRTGYLVAPAEVTNPLAKYAEDTYINTSYFNQAMVYCFTRSGGLDSHLAGLKQLYGARLDAMLAALERRFAGLASWAQPDGGFFIGMTLDRPVDVADLQARARRAGLELTDGRGFFCNGGGENFIRLPFCALTPEQIDAGIDRLAAVVTEMELP